MKLKTYELVLVPLFTALMIAGAFFRIPFPLMPITLQTFICALTGLILGPRLGAVSMTVYALLGLAGLPVFSQGGGITYVFNKSFGFIPGFILGAYIIGMLAKGMKKPSIRSNIIAAVAGLLSIYAIGVSYMLVIIRLYLGNQQIGLLYVLTANLPYFIKDAVLFAIAAVLSTSILPILSRVRAQ